MIKQTTKIIATIGPATDSYESMSGIIKAGVDVVRLNFSHGTFDYHLKNLKQARQISADTGLNVGVLVDLPGPKLRIKKFAEGKIMLETGKAFAIDTAFDHMGNDDIVGIDYEDLTRDCTVGDSLLLDDGNLELLITAITGTRIDTSVVRGGVLSNHKGLNKKGGGLSAPAIGDHDKKILCFCAEHGVDFIAVSFVSSADDMHLVRELNMQAGHNPKLIAKIERAELVKNTDRLSDVLEASDGVMVARGDLAVEVGVSQLVGYQKEIISSSIKADKFVIMATQMMESMTHAPNPTRAEISDVGNAVLDGVDAVMLSAETAVGEFPLETIEAVVDVCRGNELHTHLIAKYKFATKVNAIDKAVASSAVYMASMMESVDAVICFTESGATPRWMSRYYLPKPIIGITRNASALRTMSILRNVYGFHESYSQLDTFMQNDFTMLLHKMIEMDLICRDSHIILTHGFPATIMGFTNSIGLYQVSALLDAPIDLSTTLL